MNLEITKGLFSFLALFERKKLLNLIPTIASIIFFICLLASSLLAQNDRSFDSYLEYFDSDKSNNYTAANDSVFSVIGRWAWGYCFSVGADSNYAYIGNGPSFQVLDISNPANPILQSEYLTGGYVYGMKIKDNKAFVCTGGGLLVLDLTNPSQPEKISYVTIGGITLNVALWNNYAYVTTFTGLLWVVDLTDIRNPIKRDGTNSGGERVTCVEAKDGYVYVGNPEYPPMFVVDARNPDSLTVSDFEVGGWGYNAFKIDTLLFLGIHGYQGTNYLKIYNISNASSPVLLGVLDLMAPEDVVAITASDVNHTAYIRTRVGGTLTGVTYAIDITNITQPVINGSYAKKIFKTGYTAGLAICKNIIIASYDNGALLLDISNIDSLKLQSYFPTAGSEEKLQVKDSVAFIASGYSGLWIVDVSNPAEPKAISNFDTGGYTSDLFVEDTLAYIVNWENYPDQDSVSGLWIIDIANLKKPKILSHHIGITRYSSGYLYPSSITKSKNLIFLTQIPDITNDSTLEIIDVSNPLNPVTKSVFRTNYTPYDVTVSDTIAFIPTVDGGIRIINISNPENPIEISSILDYAYSACVQGNLLYEFAVYFNVIDISDINNPVLISSINTNNGSVNFRLKIHDNYAYWIANDFGLIDITDPKKPEQITQFAFTETPWGIAISNDKVYITDYLKGLWILKNNLITDVKNEKKNITPGELKLYQNYPNPFNPSTIIEFEVPKKENVLIELYNMLGQKVKTLLDTVLEIGKHKIEFNAWGLSSGIYFYSVNTRNNHITKKMIVLK
jgi:hypothetical protein